MKTGRGAIISKIFLVLAVLAAVLPLPAQTRIVVPTVTIKAGPVEQLLIEAAVPQLAPGSFTLVLNYDPSRLYIHGVEGGTGFLMQCPQPDFEVDETDILNGSLRISCNNVQNGEGLLCRLLVEGLRGADSTTIMRPDSVLINGSTHPDDILRQGIVTISSRTIVPRDAEHIINLAPNPFSLSTHVHYSLAQDGTEVRFAVFNAFGQLVYETLQLGNRGQNVWYFDPTADEIYLAQGVYLLLMETANGVYTYPFQILR